MQLHDFQWSNVQQTTIQLNVLISCFWWNIPKPKLHSCKLQSVSVHPCSVPLYLSTSVPMYPLGPQTAPLYHPKCTTVPPKVYHCTPQSVPLYPPKCTTVPPKVYHCGFFGYTLGGTVVHFGGYSGTLWGVQWYTLGGTVVHFGGYSGTVVPVQWYSCIGTVVQLYWYSAFVSVQWYCLSMQWCIPTCSMCILCMSTEPWCLTWTEALNEISFFQTQRLVGCFQSCFSARNTENGLRIFYPHNMAHNCHTKPSTVNLRTCEVTSQSTIGENLSSDDTIVPLICEAVTNKPRNL